MQQSDQGERFDKDGLNKKFNSGAVITHDHQRNPYRICISVG